MLEGPRVTRLLIQLPIRLGDRGRRHESSGIKVLERLFPFFLPDPLAHPGGIHSGIDDEMSDVDILRSEFPRNTLGHGAQAALDQALLNLSYTKIYAPAGGIVGKKSVELGHRIQPGQTLMAVVETEDIWVTANFKETQLAKMRRSQKVTIHVDTFGRDYRGYVENMPGARATVSAFCLPRMRPVTT